MLTVNLSRLHTMLKNAANQIRQLQNDVASSKGNFEFTIFKATSDEDLNEFKNRIAAKRAALLEIKQKIDHWLDYIDYLKGVLEEENRKNGIAEKLLAISALQRKQSELERYQLQVAPFCADQWQIAKPAEYYKTAFTETNPVYQLQCSLFNSDYPGELKKEWSALENRRQILDDELAQLNQTTIVQILSREEFIKRNFG